ncbi:MAG TPA: DUF92 domain-containing protein [Nitrososphaeraceae archaeon]|jgi:uncharacterized protein (TIGR00297 family)|nr:DUF92 domain-containing protein [Nitrososphaeraceae archaeon]
MQVAQALMWLFSIIVMAFLAYRIKVIDKNGAIAAVPIGFIVLYLGSASWFFVLAFFLVVASLFTKYKYRQKQKMGISEENGGARGWKNVVANGAPPAIFAILYYFSNSNIIFTLSFVGAISFALSDTVATEVGLLSKTKPRCILTGLQLDRGQSGGVTIQGEIAAVGSSLLIGAICGILLSDNILSFQMLTILSSAIVGGLVSTNIDSILGATIQAKYRCINCRKYLEKRAMHCNFLTVQEKGVSLIDNNVVNLLSAVLGAAVSASFIFIYR